MDKMNRRSTTESSVSFSLSDVRLEIDSLEAIFGEELQYDHLDDGSHSVSLNVKSQLPVGHSHRIGLADGLTEDTNFVVISVVVRLDVPEQYPSTSPTLHFGRIRGLCEESVDRLRQLVEDYLEDNVDMPVLFDVFQMCQTFLDDHDSLHLECVICLSSFERTDFIYDTSCGHFFHVDCFARCLEAQQSDFDAELRLMTPMDRANKPTKITFACPTCRTPLNDVDLSDIKRDVSQSPSTIVPTSPILSSESIDLSTWRQKQSELNDLFEKQKSQGGIINLEEIKLKWRIDEETVLDTPTIVEAEPETVDPPVAISEEMTGVKDSSLNRDVTASGHNNNRHNNSYPRNNNNNHYRGGGGYYHHKRGRFPQPRNNNNILNSTDSPKTDSSNFETSKSAPISNSNRPPRNRNRNRNRIPKSRSSVDGEDSNPIDPNMLPPGLDVELSQQQQQQQQSSSSTADFIAPSLPPGLGLEESLTKGISEETQQQQQQQQQSNHYGRGKGDYRHHGSYRNRGHRGAGYGRTYGRGGRGNQVQSSSKVIHDSGNIL